MSGPPNDYMYDLPKAETKPSPYVSHYFSRRQAEDLERHLNALRQKKWQPVLKSLRRVLERNANGKRYPWQKEEKP